MMNFRVISEALTSVLGAAAGGRFAVMGYRRQGSDAAEFRGTGRRVQAYYASGDFPKSSGRLTGDTQHMLTYHVDLSVSAAATMDLDAINNPNATPSQIAAIMAAGLDANFRADQSFDDLLELVYQILMDGRNFDLGLPTGTVSSRWVGSIQKDDPQPRGALVMLTGRLQYTCQTAEVITGETGVPCQSIGTIVDIVGDDVERTGVEVATVVGDAFNETDVRFNSTDYQFNKEG